MYICVNGVGPNYYDITWGGGATETPKMYYLIYERPLIELTKIFDLRSFLDISNVNFVNVGRSQNCEELSVLHSSLKIEILLYPLEWPEEEW